MPDKPLIKSLKINNLLSFGQNEEPIELESLNVLIGPNGSGKSNLLELIRLLKSAPKSIAKPIRQGGGINEWLFKGKKEDDESALEVILEYPKTSKQVMPLNYNIAFEASGDRTEIVQEVIAAPHNQMLPESEAAFFYQLHDGKAEIWDAHSGTRLLRREEMPPPAASILSMKKDREYYPELTWLGDQFESIRIYSDWNGGRNSPVRLPQDTAAPEDFLVEDTSNLNLILHNLQGKSRKAIQKRLSRLFEDAGDFETKLSSGRVQLYLDEGMSTPTPAARLSDGTLRYLALLAILCHPTPPPLICIEEPELGIHPDVILDIAELLKEASTRTQLIVTTHSDVLVSALSDIPSAIIVAEKDADGTKIRRLDRDDMKNWLERYSLGELWRMGEIGGNRW